MRQSLAPAKRARVRGVEPAVVEAPRGPTPTATEAALAPTWARLGRSERPRVHERRSVEHPSSEPVPRYARSMADGAAIRFLPFAGRRVAYAVTGVGPALVAPAWWVSHLELDWADPAFRGFWESVGEGYTLVRYDRLGVGMSDREVRDEDLTLDGDVALLRAVLDELGLEKVVLVGGSSGGCAAIAFAARFPERVIVCCCTARTPTGHRSRSPEVREAVVATVRSHWGLGSRVLADIFLGESDSAEQERLARYQREAASPETAAALLELTYRNDVRAELRHGPGADAGRAPPRRPRHPVPPRSRARGGDPGRDAGPARRERPLPVGRRRGNRWRARCVRRWLPKPGAGWPGSPRRRCSPAGSARCWRWSPTG